MSAEAEGKDRQNLATDGGRMNTDGNGSERGVAGGFGSRRGRMENDYYSWGMYGRQNREDVARTQVFAYSAAPGRENRRENKYGKFFWVESPLPHPPRRIFPLESFL